MALLGQRLRLHVGEYANTVALLSNAPTKRRTGAACLRLIYRAHQRHAPSCFCAAEMS
jgi:hypothetical protein